MRRFLLVLIPGVGLIRQDRPGAGILHFFLFAFLLNLHFMLPFLIDAPEARAVCLAGAAVVWICSARNALRRPPTDADPEKPAP